MKIKYREFSNDGPESEDWVAVAYRFKKESPWHIYECGSLYNIKNGVEELIEEVMGETGVSRKNIMVVKPKYVIYHKVSTATT